MSKPRVDPTFGISSVDVLILTERHPARRWREAQPGSCKERENLAGDAKGKGSDQRPFRQFTELESRRLA
jgi:hypothetical protein